MTRTNDIIGDETVGQLVARGLSEGDAIEARAFALYLRGGRDVGAWKRYALGDLTGRGFLEAVAPDELRGLDDEDRDLAGASLGVDDLDDAEVAVARRDQVADVEVGSGERRGPEALPFGSDHREAVEHDAGGYRP